VLRSPIAAQVAAAVVVLHPDQAVLIGKPRSRQSVPDLRESQVVAEAIEMAALGEHAVAFAGEELQVEAAAGDALQEPVRGGAVAAVILVGRIGQHQVHRAWRQLREKLAVVEQKQAVGQVVQGLVHGGFCHSGRDPESSLEMSFLPVFALLCTPPKSPVKFLPKRRGVGQGGEGEKQGQERPDGIETTALI
jgi:hypothetical protein